MSDSTGQFSNEDARRLQAQVNPVAAAHTDIILRASTVDGKCGLASGLHVTWNGRNLLVTCAHVLRPSHRYFSCAQRLKRDMIDDQATHQVAALTLLDWNDTLDLAVFSGDALDLTACEKKRYSLSDGDFCTYDRFKEDVGLATCLYGLWGEKARGHVYPDGLVYLNGPIYTAVGPLTSVAPNLIVADMAEKELLFRNDTIAAVRGTQLTGGERDLTGSSGSGLWFLLDKTPTLLGFVLGREDPCPPGTHLMRFTPIWSLRTWLGAASLDAPRSYKGSEESAPGQ